MIFLNDTSLIPNTRKETIIDWSLHQHFVSRKRQATDDSRYSRNDSRRIDNVLALHPIQTMTVTEPADNRLIVAFWYMGIAKHSVVNPTMQSLDNRRKSPEVHIGHPKGNDILLSCLIPFHAVGSTAGNNFVKVVFHLLRSMISQLAGALICSSMVTDPTLSQTIRPVRGFLILVTLPMISA